MPFSTADPADVLLNAGSAPPPLLSDHPRTLLQPQHITTTPPQLHTLSTPHTITPATTTQHHILQPSITAPTYGDVTPMLQTHHSQMVRNGDAFKSENVYF